MIRVGCEDPLAWRSAAGAAQRWLLALAVAAAFALWMAPAAAWAQAPLVWDRAEIQLWPEYDRPTTLVIVDGWLPASATLPTTLNVRLPAAAAAPHAVAVRTTSGELLEADYTILPAEDDIIIAFTTEQLSFRVEYYDPALSITGQNRALEFAWTSAYAVNVVSVRVQEPVGASGLTGNPALAALGTGGDGLNYYQRDFGAVAAGGDVILSVVYAKSSNTLSVETLGASVADTTDSPTAAPATNTNLPFILGGAAVGVGLLGLGALIYLRGRQSPARRGGRSVPARRADNRPAPMRRRHAAAQHSAPSLSAPAAASRPARTPITVAEPPAGEQLFCTQCGGKRQPDDQFCRQCGARLS